MTIKRIITPALRLLPLLSLAGILVGCLKENTDGCGTDCILTVRAYDAAGAELTASEVTSVYLYVFDDNYLFQASYQSQIGQSVKLATRSGENLHVVAWGNLNGNSNANIGTDAHGSYVGVRSQSRADSYAVCPDDIFHGTVIIDGSGRAASQDIPIYRKVGSMTVTVQNLKEFAGFADGDYSVVIRETYSNIMFDGTLSGEKVSYNPDGNFTTSAGREAYYVPPFNLIPEESGLNIDIYHGSDLVTTVSADSSGGPIIVREGVLTNVLIDLTNTINVSVTLTGWDNEQVWKEF